MLRTTLASLIAGGLALTACRSILPAPTAQDLAQEGAQVVRETIQDVVPDAERAARAQAVVTAYQEAELAYFENLNDRRRQLRALNADYEATQESFTELFEALNTERRTFKDLTVAAFVDLRGHLEPSEWEAVFEGMRSMDEKWEALAQ